MTRIVSFVVVALLALGLWRMPDAEIGTLGALDSYLLLGQRVGPEPREAADTRPTLAQVVLESSAVKLGEDGQPVLDLRGVRIVRTDGKVDLADHLQARNAVQRGLREYAGSVNQSLKVNGDKLPAPVGANFLVTIDGRALRMEFLPPQGEASRVAIENWQPAHRTSLLPPLFAIVLAILIRRPAPALFAGVFVAAYMLRKAAGAGLAGALFGGGLDVFTDFLWPELASGYRQQIVGFVIFTMARVGVMTKSGGIRGLVQLVSRTAKDVRSTRVTAWLMGLVVFFDDYANCILVGTTMRPLTDRFRIAREKLAYLVDSTAAPVAGLSVFSTWIAFEVSTFSAQLPAAGLLTTDGYAVFMETLPYRFYCILTLFLAGWVAFSGRDFGPMQAAERRARTTGQLVRPGGQPMVSAAATSMEPAAGVEPRAVRALLPLAVFIVVTLFEILRVGWAGMQAGDPDVLMSSIFTLEGLGDLLQGSQSTRALLIGSGLGFTTSIGLALSAGLRSEIPRAAWNTLRSMGVAVVILYLAWMIGGASTELGTANYLTGMLSGHLIPELLPVILFLLAAMTAFATGTSWSTMSILLPLVVGLAYSLGEGTPLGPHTLMIMSIGAVLEGAIFGDHCSPISDTTVLSSTASASDHIDHVRTQAPYALLTMTVALGLGYIPCAFFELSPWLMLPINALVLVAVLRLVGKRDEQPAVPDLGLS
jgi:Na+/H+ antiporter NhaC